jgi:hypothetical protein
MDGTIFSSNYCTMLCKLKAEKDQDTTSAVIPIVQVLPKSAINPTITKKTLSPERVRNFRALFGLQTPTKIACEQWHTHLVLIYQKPPIISATNPLTE